MAARERKPRARREYGEGSVYESPKGSGKWVAQERIDGKLSRRYTASESAAKAKLRELQELKRKRIDVHRGSQTFADWLNTSHAEWERLTKPKPRTVEFRTDMLERYIIPKLGGLILSDLRPTHVQTFVDTVYAEIQADGKYDGARTTRACAVIVNEALTLAHERHLIPDNPYSGIRLPKYRRKPITPLTDQQCRDFFAAAAGQLDRRPSYTDGRGRVKRLPAINPRLLGLWATYLILGVRRGEGLGLRWDMVDRDQHLVRIEEQIQRVSKESKVTLRVGTTKTEHGVRLVPVPRRLAQLYHERWELAQAERLAASWHEHGLLFPSTVGTALWPDNVEALFRKIRAAAGLPTTLTLHHLRHTVATLLDECGATQALKDGILGHAATTTGGKYTHARIEAMRRVVQVVEDRLFADVDWQALTGS